MNSNTKHTLFLIAFGIVLFAVCMNLSTVLHFLQTLISLILPLLLGLLFAFVLNVPMTGIERRLVRLAAASKRPPKESLLRGISLILTLACIVLLITLACTMAIPALAESVQSIYPLLERKWPEWAASLAQYSIPLSEFSEWAASLDLTNFSSHAETLWDSVVRVATSTISGVANLAFGLVIAIYVLLSKNTLIRQFKKLAQAHLKAPFANRLFYVGSLIRDTYTKFLSGQCVEAILLGCLIFAAYSVFRIPYAGLIAFLTGLFAFVPYIGALSACLIGSFLILLAAPSKLLLGLCVYLVIQFIENQFIYPHVVGTSVGLSPLWTLVAALIGGKLFGLPGIIFFIPLTAVLYTLIREHTNRKLAEKNALLPAPPQEQGG